MNQYKVRVYTVGGIGFLTQADHYEDYNFESEESIATFAARLSSRGFSG